jgi:catabolite regulation protein CreA
MTTFEAIVKEKTAPIKVNEGVQIHAQTHSIIYRSLQVRRVYNLAMEED